MASFVFRLLGRTVGRQIRPPSKNQFSSKAFCRVVLGTSVVYTFNEEEVNRPEKPIDFPKLENLTTEFFIRQACAASSDQVNAIATFTVMALEESVDELTQSITELANLFDASASTGYALTDQGHQRVVELQEQIRSRKRNVSDLEILFHFVKKLMEANSEVAFASGAEFISVQLSERIYSINQHVTRLTERVRTLELDLIRIQKSHIETVGAQLKGHEDPKEEVEEEKNNETN